MHSISTIISLCVPFTSFIAGILTLFCSILSWRWPRVYKTFKNLLQITTKEYLSHSPLTNPALGSEDGERLQIYTQKQRLIPFTN